MFVALILIILFAICIHRKDRNLLLFVSYFREKKYATHNFHSEVYVSNLQNLIFKCLTAKSVKWYTNLITTVPKELFFKFRCWIQISRGSKGKENTKSISESIICLYYRELCDVTVLVRTWTETTTVFANMT